jgi:hypothetical protein
MRRQERDISCRVWRNSHRLRDRHQKDRPFPDRAISMILLEFAFNLDESYMGDWGIEIAWKTLDGSFIAP